MYMYTTKQGEVPRHVDPKVCRQLVTRETERFRCSDRWRDREVQRWRDLSVSINI